MLESWRGCGGRGTLLHCWWECKLVQPPWRTMWRFLEKLGIELPYDPAIPLLGIHPEETRIERDTCTQVFTAAPFTIARTWKQPRCPSADKWIRKLWYIHTMEYIWVSSNEVDETGAYYTEWTKSERETQILDINKFRKPVMTILHAGQQKRHRCKEQTFGLWVRRRGWDALKE